MILSECKNLSRCSHKQVEVECDVKISSKCRNRYLSRYRDAITYIENNNKTICLFCSKQLKSTGRQNPNCKYHTLDDGLFQNIDCEHKAYILGYIASDGCLSKNNIKIASVDKDILIKIRDYICLELPIKKYKQATLHTKALYSLVINSQQILQDICRHLELNIGKKSHLVTFPPKLDDDLIKHFIRGYFDGDGHIITTRGTKNYPICGISSNSTVILEQILKYTNIPGSLSFDRESRKLEFSNNNALDFLGWLYDDSKISMDRKRDLYLDWSTWVPSLSGYGSKYYEAKFVWNRCKTNAIPLQKTRVSDSGYDVSIIDIVKDYGRVKLYGTGIKIRPDYGWYLDLIARSSITKSGYMMANGVGVIDRTYLGEILVPLIKIDESKPDLKLPIRIAQLVPRPIIHLEAIEVSEEELGQTSRGEAGWGSTGK